MLGGGKRFVQDDSKDAYERNTNEKKRASFKLVVFEGFGRKLILNSWMRWLGCVDWYNIEDGESCILQIDYDIVALECALLDEKAILGTK